MVQFPLSPAHPELAYLKRRLVSTAKQAKHEQRRFSFDLQGPSGSIRQRVADEIRARRHRERRFGDHLFSDPAWDILLALYLAELQGRSLSAAQVCIASRVPASTALRWISGLQRRGYLLQADNVADPQKANISISSKSCDLMEAHFNRLGAGSTC